MKVSFARQPSPLLVGVVRERRVRDAIAAIRNCETDGATAIDLHLSCMEEEHRTTDALRQIVSATALPILALHYSQTYEYDPYTVDEEERVSCLRAAAAAGVSAVDMQGYTFDPASKNAMRPECAKTGYSFLKNAPREVVTDPAVIDRQMAFIEEMHAGGTEVLLSTHPGIPMTAEEVVELALFLEKRGADVIKIVTQAENEEQLVESFRAMILLKKEVKTVVQYHAAGKAGRLSRIVNPLLGGHLIFCSDRYTASSNMEQLDLKSAAEAVKLLKKMQ